MKGWDRGLKFFMAIFVIACVISVGVLFEGYRVHQLINSVDDDGKVICALTGNERTRTYPILVGKVTIIQTAQEEKYYCAPGKFYWVSK